MLPSQLMDFLRVIDKHTKNLPQLKVLTIVLMEQGNLRRKGRTDLRKTLHLTSVFKQNGKLSLR